MIRDIRIRGIIGALPALLVFGADDDVPAIALVAITIVFLVFVAVVRVLAWQRHTYEFAGGRIVERTGIISRHERALEIDRIQQVDVERTLLDRLAGTCELRLETAADSGESELALRVVTVEEARRLRSLLARRVGAEPPAAPTSEPPAAPTSDPTPATSPSRPDHESVVTANAAAAHAVTDTPARQAREEVLVSVPLHRVALAAVTGPRLLAVPAAAALLFGIVAEYAAPDEIVDTAGDVVSGLSIVGGLVLFVVLAILSVIGAGIWGVIRDGGFTIGRRGSDLVVRRGLTTTRSATVPLRRVQRVTVRRRWLQQALGYASITLHSAGGGGGDSGTNLDRSLTVPLLDEEDVDGLVHQLLAVSGSPALRPHPPAAQRRSIVRGLLGTLGLVVPLAAFAVASGRTGLVVVAGLVLAIGGVAGWLAYDKLGSGADERVVASRTGLLGTTTEISPLRKTQGTTVTTSFFQRRLGLATLAVHVAGPAGGIELQDLGELTAQRLAPTLHR